MTFFSDIDEESVRCEKEYRYRGNHSENTNEHYN